MDRLFLHVCKQMKAAVKMAEEWHKLGLPSGLVGDEPHEMLRAGSSADEAALDPVDRKDFREFFLRVQKLFPSKSWISPENLKKRCNHLEKLDRDKPPPPPLHREASSSSSIQPSAEVIAAPGTTTSPQVPSDNINPAVPIATPTTAPFAASSASFVEQQEAALEPGVASGTEQP